MKKLVTAFSLACFGSFSSAFADVALDYDLSATVHLPGVSEDHRSVGDALLRQFGADGVDLEIDASDFAKIIGQIVSRGGTVTISAAGTGNQLQCSWDSISVIDSSSELLLRETINQLGAQQVGNFGIDHSIGWVDGPVIVTEFNTPGVRGVKLDQPFHYSRACGLGIVDCINNPLGAGRQGVTGEIDIGGGRTIEIPKRQQPVGTWRGGQILDPELTSQIDNLVADHATKESAAAQKAYVLGQFTTTTEGLQGNQDIVQSGADALSQQTPIPQPAKTEVERIVENLNSATQNIELQFSTDKDLNGRTRGYSGSVQFRITTE